jgi:hypothetical protein
MDPAFPAPMGGGGICHGVHGILRARIWLAIALISPLLTVVLWLELHRLTPSGILHMATFVTLCETYIGIEPHLNLWSYFLWAQL